MEWRSSHFLVLSQGPEMLTAAARPLTTAGRKRYFLPVWTMTMSKGWRSSPKMVISVPFWAVATTGRPSMGLIWLVPMPILVANSSDITLLHRLPESIMAPHLCPLMAMGR